MAGPALFVHNAGETGAALRIPLLLLLACVPAAWIPGERPVPPTARPTEVVPSSLDELKGGVKARKRWVDAMHRRAPDVDYKAIERENGVERIARRGALRAAPPPGGAPDDGDRWTERGSENQAGRTHVARESADGTTLYVGAAAGGLWRRVGEGGWTPLGDGLFGGVHWLEVLPNPDGGPDVLLTGTDGGYFYRSVDDGATWQEGNGLSSAWSQRRLTVSTDGANSLYAVRRDRTGYGAWRSDDLGVNWEQIADLGRTGGDLWVPRNGGSGVWLATADTLLQSTDRGETWTALGGWPAADNVDLAASEAWTGAEGRPRFYVVSNSRTLLRSDDGGASFVEVGNVSDYWGSLTASIVDPGLVLYGGVEAHKSADGGANFTIQNSWADYYDNPEGRLHADIMGLDVRPRGDGTERWYFNTDGGTYASDDGLATVQNLSMRGLRVSQYYGTLTSTVDPAHVAAGAQDQGYQVSTGQPTTGHLYDFDQLLSGDYAHLTSGSGTHDLVYSVYPGFMLIQVGEDEPELTYADFPGDARAYAWLPVLLADPQDPESVWFGGDRLWRYTRTGRWRWEAALASETVFGAADGEYISALTSSPIDPARMYAITSAGRFFRSNDAGTTWTTGADGLPAGQYFYGNALVASATDLDTVYVGGSGYSNDPLWVSHDGGASFSSMSEGLPSTLVYALVEEPESGTLFAGTETSAWRRLPGSAAWEDITGIEAPLVVYWSAELVPAAGLVRFGTYGRGVWDYVYDVDLDGCLDDFDRDGDGAMCGADCDDSSASVFIGAVETCGDGIDQDCNGADLDCPEGEGGGKDAPPVEVPAEGCGCSAAEASAGGAGLLAVWALLRRRRLSRPSSP